MELDVNIVKLAHSFLALTFAHPALYGIIKHNRTTTRSNICSCLD